jgi:hypothetical protein
MKLLVINLCSLLALCATPAMAGKLEVEHYSSNPDMQLPFSDAVRVAKSETFRGRLNWRKAASRARPARRWRTSRPASRSTVPR